MSTAPRLEDLHAQLGGLGAAMDADDMVAAQAAMDAYDRSLRGYMEGRGQAAPVDAIRTLLRLQNELLLRMGAERRRAAAGLDRVRRAGEATRAYAAAGAGS